MVQDYNCETFNKGFRYYSSVDLGDHLCKAQRGNTQIVI